MENEIRMTKLASCAGCGAKVGAGTLAKLLKGLPSVYDERLLVGYDTSDDACVYKISDELVLVETLDFFPPIVDDPFMFGQIAAANAISDIYAMGAQPKLALNIMAVSPQMPDEAVREVLRGEGGGGRRHHLRRPHHPRSRTEIRPFRDGLCPPG